MEKGIENNEEEFPSYFKWTYQKPTFWVIVLVWALILYRNDPTSFIGLFITTFIGTNLIFLLVYGIKEIRHNKK